MNNRNVLALAVVFAIGGPLQAEPPSDPAQGAVAVASNAGVSLEFDLPAAESDTLNGSEAAAAPEKSADASPRIRRGRPTVVSRSTESAAAKSDVPRSSYSWVTSGVMPLAAVLGVMGVAYWAVRRWLPAARAMDVGAVRVVSRAGLTPKHTVALLHVGRRFVLVGVSGDRIQRLETIEDPEEVADLLVATQSTPGNRTPFIETLEEESSSYLGSIEESDDLGAGPKLTGAGATEQLGSLLKRLRGLQKN